MRPTTLGKIAVTALLKNTVAGIPTNVVYINQGQTGKTRGSQVGRVALAEFGSIQVELLALSQRTANSTYGEKSEAILKLLDRMYPDKVPPRRFFCCCRGFPTPPHPLSTPCDGKSRPKSTAQGGESRISAERSQGQIPARTIFQHTLLAVVGFVGTWEGNLGKQQNPGRSDEI